jgi:hypothetical protein
VRLSPAGDGAEGAEESYEKQKRTTWWTGCFSMWFGSGTFYVGN